MHIMKEKRELSSDEKEEKKDLRDKKRELHKLGESEKAGMIKRRQRESCKD